MTPEQFVYWLQGYAELGGPAPTPEQWEEIKRHLGYVFHQPYVAPYIPDPVYTPGWPTQWTQTITSAPGQVTTVC